MEEKVRKWQAELEHVLEVKKEMNLLYDAKVRELKQKIADGQEQIKKEQDRQAAQMIR